MHESSLSKVPIELLNNIALYLSRSDFCNFRLVHRTLAATTLHQIPRNGISLLNTAYDLERLQSIIMCPEIAINVRQFRFLYSEWPLGYSRKEWETHPLLFAGNNRGQTNFVVDADEAFEAYVAFEAKERNRIHTDDVATLKLVLKGLPNLKSIEICHINSYVWKQTSNFRYNDLLKRIWISPYLDDELSPGLAILLSALQNDFPNIRKLEIKGSLNPDFMVSNFFKPSNSFTQIRVLNVESLRVILNESTIIKFLNAFPDISEASLRFQGPCLSINIIGYLKFPSIKSLQLCGVWTSEQEIFQTFEHHHRTLESFALKSSALTDGSWRSLFTRIRDLRSNSKVTGEGELYGRTSKETLDMHLPGISTNFTKFMEDYKAEWPF